MRHNTAHDENAPHHIPSTGLLVRTFLALGVLMLLTIAAAEVDFGHEVFKNNSALGTYVNNGVAMLIAVIKATLVVSFFMGVKYASKLSRLWAFAGFVWLTLMLITFGDYWTRSWEPLQGWAAASPQARPDVNRDRNFAPLTSESRETYGPKKPEAASEGSE